MQEHIETGQEATGIRKHPKHGCGQASEDQMVAFLAAAGDLVSYAREDEHLQLSAGTFASPEDLSAKALGATLSQGVVPYCYTSLFRSAMWLGCERAVAHMQASARLLHGIDGYVAAQQRQPS